jgi:NADPH:quinone reductase
VGQLSELPKTMRAVAFDAPGKPEVLTLRSVPVPTVGADEVLIAVHTASVAVWDEKIRESLSYISTPTFPLIIGSDGAGVVVAKGDRVTRLNVGDQAYGYCWDNKKGGFYAEYVAVPAKCVARLPRNLSLGAAGALGASGTTALQGIEHALALKAGESLIIHGASGAVGTLAIQIAKGRGARVLASASGEEGAALALRLGADAAVDGKRGDIVGAARRFAPEGVDAVLALASGEGLERSMDALRTGGRIAFPSGIPTEPKPRAGITIVPYNAISEPQDEQLARLNQAIEAHARLQVPIAVEYPLAQAAEAHKRLAAGNVLGKILLRVRDVPTTQ